MINNRRKEDSIHKFLLFVFAFSLSAFCGEALNPDTAGQGGKSAFTTTKAGKFVFSYNIKGDLFVGEVSYPTAGWVGIGFNPKKMMKDANFIVGAVVHGQSMISDEFGKTEYSHAPDTTVGGKNDIIDGHCKTENGMTTMSFTIPLNSHDIKDVPLERGKSVTILFAAGKKADLKSKHSDVRRATITIPGQ